MYYENIGGEENYPKAFNWAKFAAEQDNLDAQKILVLMYCNGDGTRKIMLGLLNVFVNQQRKVMIQ